jgi:hypothetical protein
MRRLHARSNTLISTMIFAARLRGSVQLFAQMLAAFPVDEPLPASCAAAFVPVTEADVDLCPSIQSEFAFVGSPELFGKQEHWYENVSLSAKVTQHMLAANYAAVCQAGLPETLLADGRVSVANNTPRFDIFDLVSNSAGTILSRIPGPAFDPYLARQQDAAASLRMGALMMWLRETRDHGVPLQQRIATRPAWMRFADDRHVRLTADGRALTMDVKDGNANNASDPWPTTWPLAQGL